MSFKQTLFGSDGGFLPEKMKSGRVLASVCVSVCVCVFWRWGGGSLEGIVSKKQDQNKISSRTT